ncbi:MAG: hypothetical protein N2D54_11490 [Chloroflexota bacterium]
MSDNSPINDFNDKKKKPEFSLTNQVRLILRLMGDSRVNMLYKILPLGTLVYFIIFPDLFPGPIDDAMIIGLGTYMFIELCPPDVVAEHRIAVWGNPDAQNDEQDEGDIVDSEFTS